MKKILITGISGYLAPYLALKFSEIKDYLVYGIYFNNLPNINGINLIKLNLTDLNKLKSLFYEINPDITYHLASVTPTRITNQNDEYIKFFNADITREIAKLCSSNNSLLVYTSTDLVYKSGINLKEDSAEFEPLTIYAKTKFLGEQEVKNNSAKYIILRTSLVYGFTLSSYTSFFDVAYKSFLSNTPVKAFTDQYRNPIYTEDAAEILFEIPKLYFKNDIINFCGTEYLSRYEMCNAMCNAYGFSKNLVVPAGSDEFTSYKMVKELGLCSEKLISYGFKPNSFEENLIRAKKFINR